MDRAKIFGVVGLPTCYSNNKLVSKNKIYVEFKKTAGSKQPLKPPLKRAKVQGLRVSGGTAQAKFFFQAL